MKEYEECEVIRDRSSGLAEACKHEDSFGLKAENEVQVHELVSFFGCFV